MGSARSQEASIPSGGPPNPGYPPPPHQLTYPMRPPPYYNYPPYPPYPQAHPPYGFPASAMYSHPSQTTAYPHSHYGGWVPPKADGVAEDLEAGRKRMRGGEAGASEKVESREGKGNDAKVEFEAVDKQTIVDQGGEGASTKMAVGANGDEAGMRGGQKGDDRDVGQDGRRRDGDSHSPSRRSSKSTMEVKDEEGSQGPEGGQPEQRPRETGAIQTASNRTAEEVMDEATETAQLLTDRVAALRKSWTEPNAAVLASLEGAAETMQKVLGELRWFLPSNENTKDSPTRPSVSESSESGDPVAQWRKKRMQRLAAPLQCSSCGTTRTPEWRRGPNGPRSLCNACGLIFAKISKMGAKEEKK
ncbi:hypothetical protein HDU97_007897 [Phlyctochytrium planicorne]|nr:hypothetical protein HDU97_007897 [Phlyctochytrium planicorne]